jgi:hypothetical protein
MSTRSETHEMVAGKELLPRESTHLHGLSLFGAAE